MMGHSTPGYAPAHHSAVIQSAIDRVYDDAGISPPLVGGSSRIVPLERLVLEQQLIVWERAKLTRENAAAFLNERLNQPVELSGAAAEQLSGYLYGTLIGGEILVNRDDPVTRRRFTVAHELGHYVLHALPLLEAGAATFSETQPGGRRTVTSMRARDDDDDDDGEDDDGELGEQGEVLVTGGDEDATPDTSEWEREANQFAAELLMPEALCRGLVDQFRRSFGEQRLVLAKRLGSELLVSQTAMFNRLRSLRLGMELPRASSGALGRAT